MDVSDKFRARRRSRPPHGRWIGCTFWLELVVFSAGALSVQSSMIGVDDSEYDFMILDPEHPYGSPYGGFSRASARRLSSLPLKLPNVPENVEEFKPFYMKVVDAFGRPFSCRAYHENDLDPSTLGDGMFEPPVFRSSNAKEEEESSGASGDEKSTSPPEVDNMFLRNKATKNLSILKGMCAQYHQGWWSYEWCFEDKVSQFHVNIENAGGKNEVITVEDMTNLGEFKGISSTKISNPFSTSLQDSEVQSKNEMTVEFEKREFFVEGDICAATGQPRKSEAVLLCCPSATKSRKKSIVFQDGKRMETDLVYLKGIVEWETCSYTVTICTPLLCHEQLLDEEHSGLDVTKAIDAARQKEIESLQNRAVSEVIGSVFRLDTAMNCVVYRDGGWWSYELCPGRYIRQFHEVMLLDRLTGAASTTTETQHFLGRYDAASELPKDAESQRIVNTTMSQTGTTIKAKGRSGAPLAHGGNGAYFYQEYINGDVCDNEDVTDSAIRGGEVGEGLVERSTTVRYGCGSLLAMTVKEDSTCHYVADVTVPALCQHPHFRAPVSKRQVIKCISDAPLDA